MEEAGKTCRTRLDLKPQSLKKVAPNPRSWPKGTARSSKPWTQTRKISQASAEKLENQRIDLGEGLSCGAQAVLSQT